MRMMLVAFFLLLSIAFTGIARNAAADQLSEIEQDVMRVRAEIQEAESENAQYAGGLVKALVLVRLQTLKLTADLLDQKRIALRDGATFDAKLPASLPDIARAMALEQELLGAQEKLKAAEQEAARYSGGLVQAIALSTVATHRQTIALLQQAALTARYGLATPSWDGVSEQMTSERQTSGGTKAGSEATQGPSPAECLKVLEYDTSILRTNDVFWEFAWKVDVKNGCDRAYRIEVEFRLFDKSEFLLDKDSETIAIPSNGIGKARGNMLVSPPSKAERYGGMGVGYRVLN